MREGFLSHTHPKEQILKKSASVQTHRLSDTDFFLFIFSDIIYDKRMPRINFLSILQRLIILLFTE